MRSGIHGPRYEVLWPLAKKAVRAQSAAPRLPDLSGKTVGELWDYIFRGEVVYPMIRERLRARFPGIKFIEYHEFGNFHGARSREIVAGLADKMRTRGCDAIISGIGA
ncbi:MAG: hypothetical protein HY322_09260 [Betaproteobacteria bacterium]|nr:hypothetical protein [Betaproteobacteria bacterium]